VAGEHGNGEVGAKENVLTFRFGRLECRFDAPDSILI